ncbi:hypothetical protein [Pragia fontium]|uniref:hypothetical protein n=1 Tax=Pragia fontium TaxID=82985 RepID=UPI00069AB3F0|nr:hypothetical protein [Pragia fontium]
MKWASLACGYNYDIKSCQIEILRDELVSIGISDKSLKVLDTAFICQVLGVEESLVKEFRFSGVFNKGNVSLSFKSKTVRLLNQRLGKAQARQILLRWKAHLKPLKADLTQLIEHYLKQGKTNRYGLYVTNAAGQPFNCTYKNVKTAKEWHPDTKKRKLLAHMLQGFESKAVYDYVACHQEICALEHDGFVSYDMVDDWGHEYLRVVMKNSGTK